MTHPTPINLDEEAPAHSLGDVFDLLDQAAKNLKRIQRQTVSEAGLTPPQYAVMNMLWEQDERPFKEFAEALVCTRATITGIIDTLERKQLVARKPNPDVSMCAWLLCLLPGSHGTPGQSKQGSPWQRFTSTVTWCRSPKPASSAL